MGNQLGAPVYQKRGDSPDVRPYEEKLADIRSRLLTVNYPHVWPTQKFFHSERAVYLMRQYLFANLSRRITTRPFFSHIEKKWVAYQLLLALVQCHERGVCHGDIKSENTLLTSWDWVYLVDFAPYKPTALPADNPADFSFFFDTAGRRKCYIAPERFYDSASPQAAREAAAMQLTPAMDVFSAGCVLAELFMDGQPLFDYSKLLAYRLGQYDPAPALDKVEAGVREVVLHMTRRDPAQRKTAAEYLQMLSDLALPPTFGSVVRPFFSSMLALDSDARVALVDEEYAHLKARLAGPPSSSANSKHLNGRLGAAAVSGWAGPAQQPSRQRGPHQSEVAALLSQAQAVLQQLDGSSGGALGRRSSSGSGGGGTGHRRTVSGSSSSTSGQAGGEAGGRQQPTDRASGDVGVLSVGSRGGGLQSGIADAAAAGVADEAGTVAGAALAEAGEDGDGPVAAGASPECMVLVAVLLCTLLRGARLQEHKTRVVSLLCDSAAFCDDDTRLQRVVPYLIAATSEPLAAVKGRALRGLATVLAQVRKVPPSDAKIFTEYILPCLSLLPTDAELSVQVEYACVVSLLASTARSFLEQQQRRRLQHLQQQQQQQQQAAGAGAALAEAAGAAGGASGSSLMNYDEEMAHLRGNVERVVHELLVGPHVETKLALLPHLHRLATFCGRRDTADLLLPPLLTFLNSPQWQVRAAFYRHLGGVGPSLGGEGLAAIVLPFLDRMMIGPEDAVAAEAVSFLGRVCGAGLLRKRFLLMVAAKLHHFRLLQSPSTAVRSAAVQFVVAAAGQLSPAEVFAQLLPLVRPQLTQEPLSLEAPALLVRALATSTTPLWQPSPHKEGQPLPQQQQQAPSPSSSAASAAAVSRRPTIDPATTGSHAGVLRQSIDSALHPRPYTHQGSPSPSRLHSSTGGGAVAGLSLHAMPAVPGANSMIIPAPASAASYSISLDSRFLHPGSSFLSAALEQSILGSAGAHGGHLIASASAAAAAGAPGASRGQGSRLHYSAHMSAAERGMHLVARAKRSAPHPAGGLGDVVLQRQMTPGAMYGTAMYGIDEVSPQPSAALAQAGVRDAVSAALSVGLPDGPDTAAAVAPWQPRGVLMAHLAEHRKAVTRLAVAHNGAFFASASADETVKVWDCRRLEKDVSFRSRLTYAGQGGRIAAVAACHDGQSIASGSSNGSIHVWRVEYTCRGAGGAPDRYTGLTNMRQVSPNSGSVLDVSSWGPSLLVYATQRGGVAAWDLRMSADAWALPASPSQGLLERFALDPSPGQNWLVTGSTRGHLTLWDIRFRLPVNSWQHPAAGTVASLAVAAAPPTRLGIRQGAAAGPLLYVAAGENEVGLWDVAEGRCLQVLRVLRPGALEASRRAVPSALAPPSHSSLGGGLGARQQDMMGRAKQLGIGELQTPQPRKDGCRALLPTPAGPVLWAGTDRTVRCWDAAKPQQSYVVCTAPPPVPLPHPAQLPPAGGIAQAAAAAQAGDAAGAAHVSLVDVPKYEYSQRSVQGVPVIEEFCTLERSTSGAGVGALAGGGGGQHSQRLGWAERAAAQCHQQPILDLARVDATSQPLLLTCCHDGTIKAWR
ncbi:hypothetical protein N2152v2_005807 [Parachlorella kessleri]